MISGIEMYAEGENLVLEVIVPKSLQEEDIDVILLGRKVRITGKREISKEVEREKEGYYTYESSKGSFSQEILLPVNVNSKTIRKEFGQGFLKITFEKE